ncbi:hypothetical protein GCM10009840_25060 [Pseudolysinimonas kribbensis]|uniref:hypothetical protein n=1 Tax=Pseudolysinimonas kribbensis TaxID=433641 RepID=UPI0031E14290
MPAPLDLAPLTAPMPPSAVQAWRARARASRAPWATMGAQQIVAIVIAVLVGGFFVLTFGGVIGGVLADAAHGGASFPVGGLVFIGGIAVAAVFVVRAIFRSTGRWGRWARIDAFARANGFAFSPQDLPPAYPGLIFGLGSSRQVREHVMSTSGRFFDMGGYVYTTGSGKNRSTHHWSFLAVRLDRRMPNIVLDSRANNGIIGSNLPVALARDQVLHLEGDFDRYFTLYCPKDYATDALYVFTPDLMALLIDEAAPFDVELVDDWFFAYSSRRLDMSAPGTYQRLFRIIDTVGAKTLHQTEHYRDDRVANSITANVVAPQGARLRHGVSVGAVIGVVVVAGWVGWWIVSGFLDL